jgi:Flp pilus assembly protein TadD
MNKSSLTALSVIALLAGCAQTPGGQPAPPPVGPDTLNVADAAIAGGDPSMALSVSQSVLQSDPTNVDALIHEGDAYYALMRCPAAVAAYQLALQGDPKSAAAETGMGRCLIKTDPKSAETALELAVQDDPGNAAALNDLGVARDLQGNFAGAASAYQQALLADPGSTATEVNLGLSLALSGKGQEALQYLGPLATGQGATPKIREDYAAALVAAGREDEARHVLSIDLTTDQIQPMLDTFNAIIAASQAPLPPPGAVPPAVSQLVAPTAPQLQTTAVAAAPLPGDPPLLTPSAPPPVPDIVAPPPDDEPKNADAAYTGPSPIPGAVSSSTPGPSAADAATLAAAAPAAAAPAGASAADAAAADPVAPKAAVAQPPAAPDPAPPAASVSAPGGYQVQLGALNSAPAATDAWNQISGRLPALFAGRNPDIEPASVNGKTYFRLRTGTFSSRRDAVKFCSSVTSAGHPCTVADF